MFEKENTPEVTDMKEEVVNETVNETVNENTEIKEESNSFIDKFKTFKGEEYNEKSLNTFDKFKNEDGGLDELKLFESYENLNKKFSEKREAPEVYESVYSEDIEEDFHFNEEDDLVKKYNEVAKENNLTQDQRMSILNMLSKHTQEDFKQRAEQEKLAKEELLKIPDYKNRTSNIVSHLDQLIEDKEGKDEMLSSFNSEKGLIYLEKLLSKTKEKPIPNTNNPEFNSGGRGEAIQDQINELRKSISESKKNGNYSEVRELQKQVRAKTREKNGE